MITNPEVCLRLTTVQVQGAARAGMTEADVSDFLDQLQLIIAAEQIRPALVSARGIFRNLVSSGGAVFGEAHAAACLRLTELALAELGGQGSSSR